MCVIGSALYTNFMDITCVILPCVLMQRAKANVVHVLFINNIAIIKSLISSTY